MKKTTTVSVKIEVPEEKIHTVMNGFHRAVKIFGLVHDIDAEIVLENKDYKPKRIRGRKVV